MTCYCGHPQSKHYDKAKSCRSCHCRAYMGGGKPGYFANDLVSGVGGNSKTSPEVKRKYYKARLAVHAF